ncbi:unnamed protein product [Hymenolepis diminuta]|uniref:Uncharacterized protein n=1 Tax=Hymenolepis diminuta TaxID=6216 RepID=A0A564Z9E9_HYMDI|nr:unnamed protein product [Hymenolepis diminuta]
MRYETTFLEKTIFKRESLVELGPPSPAAEFRGQDLRTACEELLLSQELCVSTGCYPRRECSVETLVYGLRYHLNYQWTNAMIAKQHDGNIYLGTEKYT